MNNQLNKALSNNRLLRNVDTAEIDLSNINGEVISKNAGEVIYREGDPADAIYLIISGEINIVRKKNIGGSKSVVLKENFFFGNDEFFEEPKRLSTAIALKDSYLIKLPEDDVQNLIQQDTAIYENLRETIGDGVSGGLPSDTPVKELDEIDIALKIDSELEGISIDNLSLDDDNESAGENNSDLSSDKIPDITPDSISDFDDDIMKALESEDSFGTTPSSPDNPLDLSNDDEAFFKTFSGEPNNSSSNTYDEKPEKTPPPVLPIAGARGANNLIDFNFGDEKDELDDIFGDDKTISDEIDKLMQESSGETDQETGETQKTEEVKDLEEALYEIEPDISKASNKEEIIPEPAKKSFAGKREEGEHMTAEDLELINKAAQLVNSNIQLDEVLQNIVDVASNLTHADRGTLYLVDKENNELWSKVLMGDNVKEVRLKIGEGVAGWVAKSKEVVNIENVKEDKRFQPSVDKNTGYETKSMLCFPIKNKETEVIGVLQLLNNANGIFSKLDEEFLNALSIHAALALENASMVQKLLQSERIDSLGKMANFLIQDIKKPVLVSKRYAEHLRAKELPPEVIQVLDMMLEQMNAVADLVQTTSSYAEGKKILHTISVSLAETLIDFSSRMEQYVQLKTCSIVNNIDTKSKVKLDVKEFFQCYSHIVKNACDAMPEGGRITVFVDEKDNKVRIHLMDEGLGIAETIKEKIFEPFTTHGKKEGAGLGLAITKKIVEAHGGTVGVESTLGEGATFTISLPKL